MQPQPPYIVCANLGPARHGRCCRLSPSFSSLKLHCPSPCPPLGPVWRARCVATSGPPVTAVVAGFPPVFPSLSNFTAREPLLPLFPELAPRLAPCGGLAVSQPRARPSWPLLPAFPQFFLSQTSLPFTSLPPAWPRVAGSLCRNLGPARHGRCCRLSPSFSSLKLHCPRPCPPLGPVWRARCVATSGPPVMAVVAGFPPVFSLSNFTALHLAPRLAPCGGLAVSQPRARPSRPLLPAFPQFFLSQTSLPFTSLRPAWPRVAGSLCRNLGPARHGRCCRLSPSFSLSNFTARELAPRLAPCGGLAVSQPRARPSWPLLPAFPQFFPLKLHCPSRCPALGPVWRARCVATSGPPVMAVVAGFPPVFPLSNFTALRPCPPPGPVWRARCVATSGPPVMAVVAGFPPVFSLSNFTARELAPRLAPCGGLAVSQPRARPSRPLLPAFPQFFPSQTSLPFTLPPAWPRVAGSLCRNLGPARHGRCCRLSPSFFSLKLHCPSTLPPAWPRVAGSLCRNLGPARHGRCCRLSPSFSLSNFTARELAPGAWPRVAGSLCRNLGPARHGRCCRLSPRFFPLKLHSPSRCPALGPVWRARCVATSGPPVMAVVAGFPPVFPLSNFTALHLAPRLAPCGGLAVSQPRARPSRPLLPAFPQFFPSQTSLPASLPPAWPRVAGSLCRNLGPARHGRCCRLSPSFSSLKLHCPSPCPPPGPVWRARCVATSGPPVMAVVAGFPPVFSLSNFTARELAPRQAPCGGLAVSQPRARPSRPLLPAFPQFFPSQTSLPFTSLPRAWPRVAGSLCRNLGPARHGRCCRLSPSFFSLKLHCPRACPPLGPVWRARCVATSGPPVMAVVAGFPPVFSLSNFTARELAPRLAPCGGLAVSQPRARPSWPLLPAFPQFFLSQTSLPFTSLPRAWPRVAGSLCRNLGPARHGRCCRLSPSFSSLKLHCPRACPPLGPVWRARCVATSGPPVMAVVAGFPPVFSLSNFTARELAPRLAPCGGLAVSQPRARPSRPLLPAFPIVGACFIRLACLICGGCS